MSYSVLFSSENDEMVSDKPTVIMLFFCVFWLECRFLNVVKSCDACSIKRFQIPYANLLVFLKHNFEVAVLCFALNGTLEDLLN